MLAASGLVEQASCTVRRISPRVFGAGFLLAGLCMAALLHAGAYPQLELGVVLLASLSVLGLIFPGHPGTALLPRLMILIYSMPFSACAGYLLWDDYNWQFVGRNDLALSYMRDPKIIGHMLAVGCLGLFGLLAGLRLASRSGSFAAPPPYRSGRGLHLFVYAVLAVLAVGLSWLSAPARTIFEAVYDIGDLISRDIGFSSAFLVSYVLLVLLYLDAERDPRTMFRLGKFALLLWVTAFIVVYLQFMHGDRECTCLLAALTILWVTGPVRRRGGWLAKAAEKKRLLLAIVPGALAVLVLLALGAARESLSGSTSTDMATLFRRGLAYNTWTAILLTNLGLSAQFVRGTTDWLYGSTYLDYVLSLPPGFIAHAIGYTRPLDIVQPAHWTTEVSMGGAHVVLVPFRNFGGCGAVLVLALYGYLIGWCERMQTRGWLYRFMYGSTAACSFLWFWYCDMNLIRALLAAGALGALYGCFFLRGRASRGSVRVQGSCASGLGGGSGSGRTILVGPRGFNWITGAGLEFEMLLKGFVDRGLKHSVVDLTPAGQVARVGTFNLRRAASCAMIILRYYTRFWRARRTYMTIASSRFGFVRDALIIWPAVLAGHRIVLHLKGAGYRAFYASSGRLLQWAIRVTLGRADVVVVLGELLRVQFHFLPPEKLRVIPNGLPLELRPELEHTKNLAPSEPVRLLFLTNLMETKGYLDVLAACQLLCERHVPFECDFCGEFMATSSDPAISPQKAKERFSALIHEAGLQEQVHYRGVVRGPEKEQQLRQAHLLLLPTYHPWEGQPIAIIEALAFATPVVATRAGGIPEQVVDGFNGFLVPARAPQAIAAAIESVFRVPEHYSKLSRNALEHYKLHFTPQVHQERLIGCILGAAATARPRHAAAITAADACAH